MRLKHQTNLALSRLSQKENSLQETAQSEITNQQIPHKIVQVPLLPASHHPILRIFIADIRSRERSIISSRLPLCKVFMVRNFIGKSTLGSNLVRYIGLDLQMGQIISKALCRAKSRRRMTRCISLSRFQSLIWILILRKHMIR